MRGVLLHVNYTDYVVFDGDGCSGEPVAPVDVSCVAVMFWCGESKTLLFPDNGEGVEWFLILFQILPVFLSCRSKPSNDSVNGI